MRGPEAPSASRDAELPPGELAADDPVVQAVLAKHRKEQAERSGDSGDVARVEFDAIEIVTAEQSALHFKLLMLGGLAVLQSVEEVAKEKN